MQGPAQRARTPRRATRVPKAGRSTRSQDRTSRATSSSAAADSNYYNWSDKFNSLGLGENVQIATSNLGGALLALVDGKWVVLRVPYPLGFYAKSINGRIDDPKIGWKGRGLWTGWSNRNPWHNEGGKGKSSMAVHFQVRPDPLAK